MDVISTDDNVDTLYENATIKRTRAPKTRRNNTTAKKIVSKKKNKTSLNSTTSEQNLIESRNNTSLINKSTFGRNKKRRKNTEVSVNNLTPPNNIINVGNNTTPLSRNIINTTPRNNFSSGDIITPPDQMIPRNYITPPNKSAPRNITPRLSSTPSSCESMSPSTPKNTDTGSNSKRLRNDECDSDGNIIPPNSVLIKQMDPQHRNRLFYKILKTKHMEIVIQNWLEDYKIDCEKGLRKIYQLFIDLASFQHIDINEFLDKELNELENILKYMTSIKNYVVMATQRYFLFFRNSSFMKKREKIESFIELFIETCAREKIIYDFHLFKKIINFIVIFSNSDKRCIRHTGVYLGLKFQTGLVNMEALIIRKVYKYQKALEVETDSTELEQLQSKIGKLKNYDDEINLMITFLHLHVFAKNWNLMDRKMWKMRLECLEELYQWIQIFPGRHLQSENISYLVKAMLKDFHRDVRYKSIEIIGKLIENYPGILSRQIPKLTDSISQEIRDVDSKVAAFAVATLSKIRKLMNIPANVREILCKYLFCPKYTVAAACGKYLAEIMIEKNKDNENEGLVVLLLNFEKKCNQREIFQHQYLIESLYDYLPIFTNILSFLNIYKYNELDEELTTIWINLVTEVMHITFFGKCSAKRATQNRIPREINLAIANRMYRDMWRFLNEMKQSGGDVKIFLPIFCNMKSYKDVHPDVTGLVQNVTCPDSDENYKIESVNSNNNIDLTITANENVQEEIVIKMEID